MSKRYTGALLRKNPLAIAALTTLLFFSVCGTCGEDEDDDEEDEDPSGNPCEGGVGCEPID